MLLRLALLLSLALALPGALRALPTEYWSDQFVVLAQDEGGRPLVIWLDFNRGTSDIRGRERVAEFVGHFCRGGTWHDLQSGEYPYPGGDMTRLKGNGAARPRPNRHGGWTLDYDSHRATFHVETRDEQLLHVQRDDPEMTTRHSAMSGSLRWDGRTFPAVVLREQVRWRGYNRLVGRTPRKMYRHFDWVALHSRRGDLWLLVQDPGQASVPDDAPDHNWGVYRSPQGVVRPLRGDDFRLYPIRLSKHGDRPRLRRYARRRGEPSIQMVPGGWSVHLPELRMRGELYDKGHMLDRYSSGLYAVAGNLYLPGAGRRTVYGVVDHIERSR